MKRFLLMIIFVKRLLFTVLMSVPSILSAQNAVTGVVLDGQTDQPLPYASVYVNGTTLGTATDLEGRFELKDVTLPATVVFSFVGYQTQVLELDSYPESLTVSLMTNDELPEVVVSGKKKAPNKDDLEYFKRYFLGDDKWGRQAKIKNEDVLLFHRTIDYYNPPSEDDLVMERKGFANATNVAGIYFKAWATEPLIVDLPSLGYEVYVDLVRFEVNREKAVTTYDMLGYFYYKPYEKLRKSKAETIEKNRKRAYYGSVQHLMRSLADDRLAENGYVLSVPDSYKKGKKYISMQLPFETAQYTRSVNDEVMLMHGLKNKKVEVKYYHRNDGTPFNLKEKEIGIRLYSESGMKMLTDTCLFLKKGVVVDNNIVFTGEISKRGVASCLPEDYRPAEDTSFIFMKDTTDYAAELLKFAQNISSFNSLFPQEKVYLEFDNTAYFQGEFIWFKAFVTHATTLERAPSGVLYVDFLAPTGQIISQQKLKIVAGQADGSIPLINAGTSQTREKQGILAYPSGFYEIRAYTQNMLDFSPEAIFSRVIPVYTQPKFVGEYDRSYVETNQDNPLVQKIRGESPEKLRDINVSFFPEGGDLVKGLPCRVAFKATGSDAFGVEGSLIVPFIWDTLKTVHDGMGSFIFTPHGIESTYFITPDGKKTGFELPKPLSSGYSMITDRLSDSKLQVNIWRTEDRVGERTALAVTCRGDVIYFEEIKDMLNSRLEIDCSRWPVGVCRMTLYDTDGRILSSRSIFHGTGNYRTPTIELDTDSMSRELFNKEVLEFKLTDQNGNPFRDRFCVSVRDAMDYGGGQSDNLQTNLLLSSDLRGYIHDPAWYLESDDEEHREALDLLTLVQGWERYEWQYMTGLEEFQERHRIEENLTMNGWILSYRKREPVSDMGVYAALIPDEDKTLYESYDYQTDSTGYFGFDLSDFYGKGKFSINVMSLKQNGESKNEKSKRIRFERADRPEPRPYLIQETDLSHNESQVDDYKVSYTDNDLTPEQRRKLGRMIDDVDIEENSVKRRFIDYDTFTSFEAEEDTELALDEGEYSSDIYQYFLDKGIRIKWSKPESTWDGESVDEGITNLFFYVHNRGSLVHNKPFDRPLDIDMVHVRSIIISDRPMYMKDIVDCVPLLVEALRKRGNYTWEYDARECLDKYTLVDVLVKEDRELLFDYEIRNLGRRATTVKGFTKPVQYYAPEYPDGPILGNTDARRTLYWNPNVITDEDGRARIEFYNNGFTRKFTIRGAGITASGVPYVLNYNW